MSANERLQTVQAALEQRGVRDVKFCFAPGFTKLPSSVVKEKVADFLEAYLDGRGVEVDSISCTPA